jgi:hypothetical protein
VWAAFLRSPIKLPRLDLNPSPNSRLGTQCVVLFTAHTSAPKHKRRALSFGHTLQSYYSRKVSQLYCSNCDDPAMAPPASQLHYFWSWQVILRVSVFLRYHRSGRTILPKMFGLLRAHGTMREPRSLKNVTYNQKQNATKKSKIIIIMIVRRKISGV